MNLDDSLRDKTIMNGPFEDTAQLSQGLKFALRRGRNWEAMALEDKEALEMIAAHLAMILIGDAKEPQHWNNVAAYARLRARALEQGGLENSVSRLARIRTQFAMAPAQPDSPDEDGAA